MKKTSLFLANLILAGTIFISCSKEDDPSDENTGSGTATITMGNYYVNDIYYSLSGGVVKELDRSNWDIGFYTSTRSSTIITNDGNGTELYTYPNGDTTAWNKVSIVGIEKWKKQYNSYTGVNWQGGAFDRNALGHPDYGWGKYNSTTHDVVGDSLFVIKIGDLYKKIWIKKRKASENKYYIKYANIDGTNEVEKQISITPFDKKNFVYFSLKTNEVIDREPEKTNWDFVFTKYMSPAGPAYYAVTGVLTNEGIEVIKLDNFDVSSDVFSADQFKKQVNLIGYDWKLRNEQTNEYSLVDKRAYFVRKGQDVYKIIFKSFKPATEGGVITFDWKKLNSTTK